ncbi:response regulator [Inhella proteolytica]|uniref:Response regulator transcription factor n=1 Tax=Inhella proteolytica TaxID=2795029 RepID=A0A931J1P1_9BURK|nr:response regulator transcription factor [Inhella proteolytica]MBH9577914.1 response regulator transcription factor [Inhella proteolytica]
MIRVGIVDDHAIVRAGLRQYLSEHTDLRVVGEASNGQEALELARQTELDVLLLDISMPGHSGVDALAAIKARFETLPVLILSGFPETQYASALLRQGAAGYLSKDCDPDEIADAIRVVARGRRYISAAVAELLAESAVSPQADKPAHETLSERELQVFLRLAKGETVGQVADSLCLSVKTVSTYRTRVLEKLKLHSNSELTYYALKQGLIQ